VRTLAQWLGIVPERQTPSPFGAIHARLDALEARETVRAAEHAAMVDQLDRLYKRISARITREHAAPAAAPTESPLDMRRRLRG